MAAKILQKENYKRSTWKNGLGFTDEIAIFPEGSSLVQGNFLWRLSSARIEKASPFSLFPNHDRILIILKGAGVQLIHTFEEGGDEDVVQVPPHELYEFPGDIPSRCELLDGAITDFSIFLRKGEVEPMITIEKISSDSPFQWNPEGKWNFAFALEGNFHSFIGTINEGDCLFSDQDAVEIQSINPNGKLLLVSLG